LESYVSYYGYVDVCDLVSVLSLAQFLDEGKGGKAAEERLLQRFAA
jgi:hypothetical protein